MTFLDFKVGIFFNLRFQMQETDELNVTPPQWTCFVYAMLYRLLKREREKLEKISDIEHFKKQYCAGKTVVMNTKRYMHLLIGKKGENGI